MKRRVFALLKLRPRQKGTLKRLWDRTILTLFMIAQISSVIVLVPAAKVSAETPPTLSNFASSNWADSINGNEVTGTLTWSAGDFIVVVGVTENGSTLINTPTATGLSFSLITHLNNNDGGNVGVYLWTATAASSGSSAITATNGDANVKARGIDAFAYSGSAGLGNTGSMIGDTPKVIPLTRANANSAVISVMGDWNAVNDTSVTSSPAGGTVDTAVNAVNGVEVLTSFVVDWGDQGAAGSDSYGITNHTGTVRMSGLAIEIKGAAATTEQEGFRWRDDDGDEDGATWLASQDTDISRQADTNTRLRTLLNTTGDAGAATYQLEYKKDSESTYKKVPTGPPVAGAVTYGAAGTQTVSGGATSRNPALPTGVTSSSELWAVVGSKNNATHSSSTTNWTKVLQQNSGANWTVSVWRYTGADATSASSITVTWTGSVASFGQSWRMQGRTGTDALGTPSTSTGTTSTHTSNAVTTTSPGSRVMYIDASAANTALAQPTSWTENLDNGSGTSVTRLTVGGRDFSSSGSSSGNISVTGANAAWVQTQIELPAPQPAILMSASSNITASGENTTAQLTAPSGKTTSDFVAGRMQDDENPADSVDITADDYTEMEWSLTADSNIVTDGELYQFRVTNNGTPIDTYTVTPEWTITSNTAPGSPSSLAQTKTDNTTIATGGWTNETSIKLTATVTDSDGGDTVKICAEVDPIGTAFSSPAGDGDGCSGTAVSTGQTATVTIGGLSTDTEYHWQIKAKDAAGAYSSWVGYGGNTENPPTNPAARDFGVDTSAPTAGTVYDGTSAGVDKAFSDSSLSALSANWSGFTSTTSGLQKYEYSIGTTAGATDVKAWTDNSTNTSVTATGLTLQTSKMYFFNVKAYDNAGNTVTQSSNGQLVAPSVTFSVSPSSITFDALNAGNSYTDSSKTTTLTTSTNAYGGYVVRLAASDLPRSAGNFTIPDFNGGTYASPAAWGSSTGFGFSTNDADIFPQSGSCPGGGTAPCFAPYSQSKPGDIVASHTANVSGSPITNEAVTISHRVTVSPTQAATTYQAIFMYTITPLY